MKQTDCHFPSLRPSTSLLPVSPENLLSSHLFNNYLLSLLCAKHHSRYCG